MNWRVFNNKLQLSSDQADRCFTRQTLPRHGSQLTSNESCSSCRSLLTSPFLCFLSPSSGYTLYKIGLVPTTNQWKGMEMGICSRPIDPYKLYNRLCCLWLPIVQSVIIRWVYIIFTNINSYWLYYIYEYLLILNGLLTAQGYLETPLVSLFHYMVRVNVQELEKSMWSLLQHICELSWVCRGWDLEINLHPFQPGHPSFLMPSFLSNTSMQTQPKQLLKKKKTRRQNGQLREWIGRLDKVSILKNDTFFFK